MAALGAVIASFLTACQPAKETQAPAITTGVVMLGPASNYRAGTVSTQFLERFGIVVTNDSGTPVVILPICPRDGGIVAWDPKHNAFVCPKDGSTFDLLGRPLKSSTQAALRAMPAVRGADGELSIDLGKLHAL